MGIPANGPGSSPPATASSIRSAASMASSASTETKAFTRGFECLDAFEGVDDEVVGAALA